MNNLLHTTNTPPVGIDSVVLTALAPLRHRTPLPRFLALIDHVSAPPPIVISWGAWPKDSLGQKRLPM